MSLNLDDDLIFSNSDEQDNSISNASDEVSVEVDMTEQSISSHNHDNVELNNKQTKNELEMEELKELEDFEIKIVPPKIPHPETDSQSKSKPKPKQSKPRQRMNLEVKKIPKEELDDANNVNIIDTFLISHRNTIVCENPNKYMIDFVNEIQPHMKNFYLGYSPLPLTSAIEIYNNLGLGYLYLMCKYEKIKYSRHAYNNICRKLAPEKKCINHLYALKRSRVSRGLTEYATYYMFVATDALYIRIPETVKTIYNKDRETDARHIRRFLRLEKKSIKINRLIYD